MEKTRLEMSFRDEDNKLFRLSLDGPREDLKEDQVRDCMELILDKNIFIVKNRSLASIDSARLVRIEIEELSL